MESAAALLVAARPLDALAAADEAAELCGREPVSHLLVAKALQARALPVSPWTAVPRRAPLPTVTILTDVTTQINPPPTTASSGHVSAKPPAARAARGVSHNAALRQLANRLVGILHGCLKTGTLYDETTARPHHLIEAVA